MVKWALLHEHGAQHRPGLRGHPGMPAATHERLRATPQLRRMKPLVSGPLLHVPPKDLESLGEVDSSLHTSKSQLRLLVRRDHVGPIHLRSEFRKRR